MGKIDMGVRSVGGLIILGGAITFPAMIANTVVDDTTMKGVVYLSLTGMTLYSLYKILK